MASAIKKVNSISQIVRLKKVVRRWKSISLTRRHSLDSDSDDSTSCRTPSGSLAFYVGPDRIRFVVPTRFLNLPVFVQLLDQAEEEFGYQSTGALVLACEPGFFGEILRFLGDDEEKYRLTSVEEFLNLVSGIGSDQLTCKESEIRRSFSPLLPKNTV